MRVIIWKKFIFALMLAAAASIGVARECSTSACEERIECGCNPLNCGHWSVQFQIGVAPLHWVKRPDLAVVACQGGTTPPPAVTNIGNLPSFHSLYGTPWTFAGQLSYALTDNIGLFFELGYVHASHKDQGVNTQVPTSASSSLASITQNTNFLLKLGNYRFLTAYFGSRYYFDRWCNRTSLFIGDKIGLVHHYTTKFEQLSAATVITQYNDRSFFKRTTTVSAGVHAGLDFCFCDNWNVVFTAEFVADCGPRSIDDIFLQAGDITTGGLGTSASNVLVGSMGAEFFWPITAGIKYNF